MFGGWCHNRTVCLDIFHRPIEPHQSSRGSLSSSLTMAYAAVHVTDARRPVRGVPLRATAQEGADIARIAHRAPPGRTIEACRMPAHADMSRANLATLRCCCHEGFFFIMRCQMSSRSTTRERGLELWLCLRVIDLISSNSCGTVAGNNACDVGALLGQSPWQYATNSLRASKLLVSKINKRRDPNDSRVRV